MTIEHINELIDTFTAFPEFPLPPFFYSYKLQSHMAGCEVKKEEEESGCLIQK